MTIVVIGVTGRAGSLIAAELVARGHQVTGLARKEDADVPEGVTLEKGDATDASALVELIRGSEAVIHAAMFSSSSSESVINAVKSAEVPRLLVVGGAGSLLAPDGTRLIDSPEFPEAYKPEAQAGIDFLDQLKQASGFEWTFLRPQAEFVLGERTGKFRLGTDRMLLDANGRSWITYQDLAIAMVDEYEKNAHPNQAFTVGY